MIKEEKKAKWNIYNEYPKWVWVEYKLKDVKFFKEVRKLLVEGLDPKHELTIIDIVSIFGNVKTFKSINSLLPLDARKTNWNLIL
jgi:hypothetical protein